jgi:8-amino-7-oxononanoate synthase
VSLEWLNDGLDEKRRTGLLRELRSVRSLPDGWCELDGQRLHNFASNDYLSLAHDSRVINAARTALEKFGVGAQASALVCGRSEVHSRLEAAIADLEGEETAILFPSGYAANVGTLTALISSSDDVFCDRFNHASLVDGCRLSGARLRVYRHDRLEVLERELNSSHRASGTAASGRRWIVTDGVFSMDGDLAPLPEICDLAERYGAEVIVDEAHGTGVFGEGGRGVCELTGTESRVAVRIGTLSKAIGAQGGFVAGSFQLRDFLWNSARTQMFSTALSPIVAAGAEAAIRIIQSEPERRERLRAVCRLFRQEWELLSGTNWSPSVPGPILPIIVGDADTAVAASRQLREAGFFVPAIRPPTVSRNASRLRVTLSSATEPEVARQLAQAISAQP